MAANWRKTCKSYFEFGKEEVMGNLEISKRSKGQESLKVYLELHLSHLHSKLDGNRFGEDSIDSGVMQHYTSFFQGWKLCLITSQRQKKQSDSRDYASLNTQLVQCSKKEGRAFFFCPLFCCTTPLVYKKATISLDK